MGTIHFLSPLGERHTVSIKPGNTVMETAVSCEVEGIEAQCYGAGICGTCHVYVRGPLVGLLPPTSDWERDMLANLELARGDSRLSCQIRFEEKLDGIEFTLPERQDAVS